MKGEHKTTVQNPNNPLFDSMTCETETKKKGDKIVAETTCEGELSNKGKEVL